MKGDDVVLVPLKKFDESKSRLRATIDPATLVQMTRRLAEAVIAAASPRPVVVLCDDDEVERFARDNGAHAWRVTAATLNGAVTDGYSHFGTVYQHVIVVHADLAAPRGLGAHAFAPGVTVVTDRHGTGSNVLALPAGVAFHFAYGPGSAARHRREAERLGLPVTVVTDSPWGWDVDAPEDIPPDML